MGLDPGYAIVGVAVLDSAQGKISVNDYIAVTTAAGQPFERRLSEIYNDISFLMDKFQPECVAVERLYFTTNRTTAIDVAQARGVLLLAAQQHGADVCEYTPLQVKQAVTGYGKATKSQVQEMTRRILGLKSIPKPDDVADALAIAICHAHVHGSVYRLK
jgi:crossover junction endodeoxyribonuclease RuvC